MCIEEDLACVLGELESETVQQKEARPPWVSLAAVFELCTYVRAAVTIEMLN
jgi:hypothetical protein